MKAIYCCLVLLVASVVAQDDDILSNDVDPFIVVTRPPRTTTPPPPPPTTTLPPDCESDPLLENGITLNQDGGNGYGSRRSISCPVGYRVVGASQWAVCGQNGKWVLGGTCARIPTTLPPTLPPTPPPTLPPTEPRTLPPRPQVRITTQQPVAVEQQTVIVERVVPVETTTVVSKPAQDWIIALSVVLAVLLIAIILILIFYLSPLCGGCAACK